MEGIVQSYTMAEFAKQMAEELGEGDTQELVALVETVFKGFRSPDGEKMVLQDNMFVEQLLPQMVMRKLSEEEMDAYRRPFLNTGEERRPTLTWPRQIPLNGDPTDVVEIVESYGKWMSENTIPKLFIKAEPGATIRGNALDFCRTWPNQTEVTVPGIHFVQEDSPDKIGEAISSWYQNLGG
jgi:haloalkane dehalogenase